jgi:hypothetical protein
MVYARKMSLQIGTYNAPSSATLSLLACALNVDESFDSIVHSLDPLDRMQVLYRLLSTNAARH